jgi:hypothetical protein
MRGCRYRESESVGGEQVVMLQWAADVLKNRLSKQDPEANCLPAGIPREAFR